MSTNYFARHIGLLRGENLYQIKRGNNGISRNLADMIVKSFPEINLLWLLTGEGQMFTEPDVVGDGIPFYNLDVENQIRNIEELDPLSVMVMPVHVDGDIAMVYSGRAMGDIIPPNTIVMLKKILPETIIPGGEYVILTKNVVTLRIVCYDHNVSDGASYGDTLKLVSADSAKFNDIYINRKDVEMVYKVTAKIMIN